MGARFDVEDAIAARAHALSENIQLDTIDGDFEEIPEHAIGHADTRSPKVRGRWRYAEHITASEGRAAVIW